MSEDYSVDLSNTDWLAKAFQRFGIGPIMAGGLMLLLNLVIDFSAAFGFNAFYPAFGKNGLVSEPVLWVSDFLAQPVLVGFYCWIQAAGGLMFRSLFLEGVVPQNATTKKILDNARARLQNPILIWSVTGVSLAGAVFFAWATPDLSDQNYLGWMSLHPAIPWMRALPAFLTAYIGLMFIYDMAQIILTLTQVFASQPIALEPFHPDRAGGLGAIGKFSARLGILLAALGVTATVTLFSTNAPAGLFSLAPLVLIQKVAGVVLYVILAPAFYYLIVNSAHQAMVTYRDMKLKGISEALNTVIGELQAARQASHEAVEPLMKKVQLLKDEYALIAQFPVWPFNQINFRGFVGIVSAPIIPSVTTLVIDLLKRLLNPGS